MPATCAAWRRTPWPWTHERDSDDVSHSPPPSLLFFTWRVNMRRVILFPLFVRACPGRGGGLSRLGDLYVSCLQDVCRISAIADVEPRSQRDHKLRDGREPAKQRRRAVRAVAHVSLLKGWACEVTTAAADRWLCSTSPGRRAPCCCARRQLRASPTSRPAPAAPWRDRRGGG